MYFFLYLFYCPKQFINLHLFNHLFKSVSLYIFYFIWNVCVRFSQGQTQVFKRSQLWMCLASVLLDGQMLLFLCLLCLGSGCHTWPLPPFSLASFLSFLLLPHVLSSGPLSDGPSLILSSLTHGSTRKKRCRLAATIESDAYVCVKARNAITGKLGGL